MGTGLKRRNQTLGGIFFRYVIAMLAGLSVWGVCTIIIFNIIVNAGYIYPANYTEKRIDRAYDTIHDAKEVTNEIIPSLCKYAVFSKDGKMLSGNMEPKSLKIAWNAVKHRQTSGKYFYKVIYRDKEYVVLEYCLVPQYKSAFLREYFITPQNLLIIITVLGGIVIILLSSIRFGKKIKGKMQSVMMAAEKIKEQELEYETVYCGVKEIDECLSSIDEMRMALKNSLEQQWKTEQDKNRQMSALAHDIKTPLTVVRGNTELLLETKLSEEQEKYIAYIADSSLQIQNYVQTLIDVTKSSDGFRFNFEKINTDNLFDEIKKQAFGLGEVYHIEINWLEACDIKVISGVYDQIVRAVMNIIKNAAEHTKAGGQINIYIEEKNNKLEFTVEDTGSGFTREALLHGTEQFFMDDKSRSGSAHYGIGLFSAETIAKRHGGEILLANSTKTKGARVKICFGVGGYSGNN